MVSKRSSGSNWASVKFMLFFLLPIAAGFVLTSTSGNVSGFQDALFGSGVLLWVIGVFGAVYCIVRRAAGPRAAKLAVLVLVLISLTELFSGIHDEKHHDPF